MKKRPMYKGFSTFEFQANKSFSMSDVELVKLDILNHIFTKKGERVNMPEFGTRIPEMVFEPLDEATLDIVEDELRQVFEYDPRVSLIDISVTPQYDSYTIVASARLFYVELNVTDTFELNIQFNT